MSQEPSSQTKQQWLGAGMGLGITAGVLTTIAVGRWFLRRNQTYPSKSSSLIPYTLSQDLSSLSKEERDKEDKISNISEILSSSTPHYVGKHIEINYERLSPSIALQRSKDFLTFMNMRRSIRFFDTAKFDINILKNCLMTGATSPSGAHCQPWHFVIVSNHESKMKIRKLVEKEEQMNYERRMKEKWVSDVTHIVSNLHGTDAKSGDVILKPYLTEAPYLVIVMLQKYGIFKGKRYEHYYSKESCGIACGMLIAALHNCGLTTLTSTPMGAESGIRDICQRPQSEKVYLLMPVGYPAKDATVPYRSKKLLRKHEKDVISIV